MGFTWKLKETSTFQSKFSIVSYKPILSVNNVKIKWKMGHIFVTFSEYLNFTELLTDIGRYISNLVKWPISFDLSVLTYQFWPISFDFPQRTYVQCGPAVMWQLQQEAFMGASWGRPRKVDQKVGISGCCREPWFWGNL